MRPSSTSRFTSTRLGRNRRLQPTRTVRPARPASTTSASVPSRVCAKGFSTKTCQPRRSAARAWSRWRWVGEQMTAPSAVDPKALPSSAVVRHCAGTTRRTSARRSSLGSRTATTSWPSARRFFRCRWPMDPAPITTNRIARATRLDVRPSGAAHRPFPLLSVARMGVAERVLPAQLVHGPPGELDDLLVRQVTEVRADLFALLAEAEEVLLDDVLVGGTLLARDGLPDQPLLERQVPERRPRVRRREEEDLGLEVDLLAELDRLAHRVGGLAGRGDHERAVGVAEHALGLLDRDLHLLERLPALVDGLEDLGAGRLDAIAGLTHPDFVALLEHVRPALTPGAQNVVGDDVGAARAAPHDLEAGPPLALAQLAEELEGPAVVRHEEVVEEVDVDGPIARLDELHLVHDLARAAQPIGVAEVRRVTILTRARGVRAAPRGDHRDGVLSGRHRSAVDPLRLPVEVADGVQLVHLVLGPPRAERPRQRIEPLLARGDGRAEAVVAHRPLARADHVAVGRALRTLHRRAPLQPVQHLREGDLTLLLPHGVHGETLDHELGH